MAMEQGAVPLKRRLELALSQLDDACQPSSSAGSQASASAAPSPAARRSAKRQRLAALQNNSEDDLLLQGTSTRRLAALLGKQLPSAEDDFVAPGEAAATAAASTGLALHLYRPDSLPDLLSRISTFRLATFSSDKPAAVSPPSCARRGWVNSGGRERLSCPVCHRAFVIAPPSASTTGGWSSEVGSRLADKYAEMLRDEHAQRCPWRTRACPATLYRVEPPGGSLSNARTSAALAERARRIDTQALGAVQGKQVQVSSPLSDEETTRLVALLQAPDTPASALGIPAPAALGASTSTEQPATMTAAAVLALFGWEPLAGSAGVITCSYCSRHVGLWSFAASESGQGKALDVVQEHHSFCAFLQPRASLLGSDDAAATRSRAAWEQLVDFALRRQSGNSATTQQADGREIWDAAPSSATTSTLFDGSELTRQAKARQFVSYVKGLLNGGA